MNIEEKDNLNYQSKEITLTELIGILWDKKLIITFFTSVFAIGSVVYSLSLSNLYTSNAVLMPADKNNTTGSMLGQYSSLAALGGFSIESGSGNKSVEALARLRSYEFFSSFFLPAIFYPNLVAIEKWDSETNTLIYNDEVFDNVNKTWKNEAGSNGALITSYQEAFLSFNKALNFDQNEKTSLIRISFTHESPYIAKSWLDIIIKQINNSMRNESKMEVSKSIDFLENQTQKIKYEELKKALASLQQEQMKSLMLMEASDNFVFKVIDSPIVPEKKSGPRRSLIVILSTIFGFILISMFTILRFYTKNNKI